MFEVLVISWALAAGMDLRVIAILGVSLFLPFLAFGVIGLHTLLNRPRTSTRSAVFCESVARELRSGASLRVAIDLGFTGERCPSHRCGCQPET
jgi:hypothetical protein